MNGTRQSTVLATVPAVRNLLLIWFWEKNHLSSRETQEVHGLSTFIETVFTSWRKEYIYTVRVCSQVDTILFFLLDGLSMYNVFTGTVQVILSLTHYLKTYPQKINGKSMFNSTEGTVGKKNLVFPTFFFSPLPL